MSNDPEAPTSLAGIVCRCPPFRINIMRQVMIKELFFDSKIYIKIYQPDSQENRCAVILSHGYNSSHADLEDIARSLAERGYFVCTFDFCGGSLRSKSMGKSTDMSVNSEIDDLNKVIEFTKETSGADKIFLYGESQGGFVSALTACRNKAVDGMALLYPAFCIPDDWKNKPLDEMKSPFDFMGMTISKSFYDGLPDYDVFERIRECDIPVLILHGTADRLVNEDYAKRAAKCFPNAVLKLYDGEGHGFSPKARQHEISDVIEFFDSIS